jgi:hypothetical protein
MLHKSVCFLISSAMLYYKHLWKYTYLKRYLFFLSFCIITLFFWIVLWHCLYCVKYFLQWVFPSAFLRETGESFSSLVTLDLGTIDNYNESQLRERLYRQIADYRRLGNIASSEENFNFRSFGGKSADFFPNKHNFPPPFFSFPSFQSLLFLCYLFI